MTSKVEGSTLRNCEVRDSVVVGSVLEGCHVEEALVIGTVAREERFERGAFVHGEAVEDVGTVRVPVEAGPDGASSGTVRVQPKDGGRITVCAVVDVRAVGLLEDLTGERVADAGHHGLLAFSASGGRLARRLITNLDVFRECCPCAYLRVGRYELAFVEGEMVTEPDGPVSSDDILWVNGRGEVVASRWSPAGCSVLKLLSG
ncbi:MAG: hypothetical protein GXO28_00145 [Methanopyri archaeon]|nr:hypothetical protein [Methanopyri archaeon]